MTHIATTSQPANARMTADVVIVGSGAGSAAVAGSLRRAGADVIMVEAGRALTGRMGQHLRNTQDDDAFNQQAFGLLTPHAGGSRPVQGLPGARGIHAVGGMLTAWSHQVPRPSAAEVDGPIPPDKLSSYLARAEKLFWANDSLDGDGSGRQQWIQQRLKQELALDTRRVVVAARRTDDGKTEYAGADALLGTDDDPGTLTILTGHVARRIEHIDGRGVAVVATSTGGESVTISAGRIVVGGGALGTPQLLHASGLRHPALGRYLTDHLNVVSTVWLKPEALTEIPAATDAPIAVFAPVTEERPFHTAILDLPSIAHQGFLEGAEETLVTSIGIFVGTEPEWENRLVFDDHQVDEMGLPRVRAEVELTKADHDRAQQAVLEHYRIGNAIGEPWRSMNVALRPLGASLHLMGTHRIGKDDRTSVADTFGRLHGSENIYVVGNGSIPTRNSCNPTLTTVALALRTADAIVL